MTSTLPHKAILTGTRRRILAVLVLYGLAPEQGPAFRMLHTLLAEDAETAEQFARIVYDNSPTPHALQATPFPCAYRHDETKPGLARPYQYGMDHALGVSIPWLLLLDQDTVITAEYLQEGLAITHQVASESDIVAVVPKILQGEELLSPHWPHRHPDPEPLQ